MQFSSETQLNTAQPLSQTMDFQSGSNPEQTFVIKLVYSQRIELCKDLVLVISQDCSDSRQSSFNILSAS